MTSSNSRKRFNFSDNDMSSYKTVKDIMIYDNPKDWPIGVHFARSRGQ